MTYDASLLARNVKRVGRLDLPGAGQVRVVGDYAYVAHMDAPHGTTIVDVSDPKNPRVTAEIMLEDHLSHTHKVRVEDDIMIVNVEQADRHFLRKADGIAPVTAELETRLGRTPTDEELAAELGAPVARLPELFEAAKRGYRDGGFKIYDVSNKSNPRLLHYERTHGFGTHRFDMDSNYAYISTEMPGFVGNILMVYDLADPAKPREISRWWMPDQENADGRKPNWKNYGRRLHHTMRNGNTLWASCWEAGIRVIDASDITELKTIGSYEYHPPYPAPTHTVVHLPFQLAGKEVAVVVDEEHKHRRGQHPASMWVFDVTDPANIKMMSGFHVSELDSPWARAKGRFGAHQFQEVIDSPLVFVTWFSGGVRVVDISDPYTPEEVGHFIPEPVQGQPSPQSNDIFVDKRGLAYVVDRHVGFDILEYTPH